MKLVLKNPPLDLQCYTNSTKMNKYNITMVLSSSPLTQRLFPEILTFLINFILHQACELLVYLLVYCEINKIMESILGTTWLGFTND